MMQEKAITDFHDYTHYNNDAEVMNVQCFMFKVCLYVINILLLNWSLGGRGVRTPG